MAKAKKGHTRPGKNKRNQKNDIKRRSENQRVLESFNKK